MSKFKKQFAKKISVPDQNGALVYLSVSVGDIIYDILRVNPQIIEGINFLKSKEDISSALDLGKHIIDNSDRSLESLKGLHANYSGYGFERIVGSHFQKQGYEVEFPKSPNNPASDIIIGGDEFQIKLGSDHIKEHFSKYDIPVITTIDAKNEFLKKNPEMEDQVYAVPFTANEIKEFYNNSINAAEEIYEDNELFFLPIPEIVGIVPLYSVGKNILKNDITVGQRFQNIIFDGAIKGSGAGIGAFIGSILGPFGTIIGGGLGFIISSPYAHNVKLQFMHEKEIDDLKESIDRFMSKVSKIKKSNEETLLRKIEFLENYFDSKIEKNFFKKIFSSETRLYETLQEMIIPKMEKDLIQYKKHNLNFKRYSKRKKETLKEILDLLYKMPGFATVKDKIKKIKDDDGVFHIGKINFVQAMINYSRKIGISEELLQKEVSDIITSTNNLVRAIKRTS